MHFADKEFFFSTIKQYGLDSDRITIWTPDQERDQVVFQIPVEHSRLFYFAKLLRKLAAPKSDLLIMPTEWGIWPSSDNWHLYTLIRTACGDSSHLQDLPCHCFSESEHDLSVDFLQMFLLSSWEFFIFAFHREEIFNITHDGFVVCYAPHRANEIRAQVDATMVDSTGSNRKLSS